MKFCCTVSVMCLIFTERLLIEIIRCILAVLYTLQEAIMLISCFAKVCDYFIDFLVIILVYMHYDSLKVTTCCSSIYNGNHRRRNRGKEGRGRPPDLFEGARPPHVSKMPPRLSVKSNALFSELIVF